MSWSFSPVLVAAFLEECCSDTAQSAQSNTTPTPDQYYWPDKPTEHSRLSRFGMTFAPLMVIRGEELLTWYLADSRVKTSALPEAGPDWTAKGQGYGEKWLGLLGKYDPVSCSLKTAQLSLLEDLTGCCPTLPRWGLMLAGELYPQPMLEPCTVESASGYWPTPQTRGFTNDGDLIALAKKANSFEEMSAMAYRAAHKKKAAYWPTPTVCGNHNRKGASATSGDGLATALKMWPTPQASDNRDRGNASTPAIKRRIENGKQVMLSMCVSSENGRLNPDWVEWLMGWPIGHTDLKPLETARFQEFEQQHGVCFMDKSK